MTIDLIVQSTNNKTIELIKLVDMSKIEFVTNNQTTVNYDNYILSIHTSIQSLTLSNFWSNLSTIKQDFVVFVLAAISIVIIFFVIKLIKLQAR